MEHSESIKIKCDSNYYFSHLISLIANLNRVRNKLYMNSQFNQSTSNYCANMIVVHMYLMSRNYD